MTRRRGRVNCEAALRNLTCKLCDPLHRHDVGCIAPQYVGHELIEIRQSRRLAGLRNRVESRGVDVR